MKSNWTETFRPHLEQCLREVLEVTRQAEGGGPPPAPEPPAPTPAESKPPTEAEAWRQTLIDRVGREAAESFLEYQKYDPFRTPDWRWQRAKSLALQRRARPRATDHDDPAVVRALRFLVSYRAPLHEPGAAPRPPELRGIAEAHAVYRADELRRAEIEARLLAAEPTADIARKVGCTPAGIDAYSSTFFDVADRLGAQDWIHTHALRLTPGSGRSATNGDILRYYGFTGGPAVVDQLVKGMGDVFRPWEPSRAVRDLHVARLGLNEILSRWVCSPEEEEQAVRRAIQEHRQLKGTMSRDTWEEGDALLQQRLRRSRELKADARRRRREGTSGR